jgi:hypothetical protein
MQGQYLLLGRRHEDAPTIDAMLVAYQFRHWANSLASPAFSRQFMIDLPLSRGPFIISHATHRVCASVQVWLSLRDAGCETS